MRFIEQALDAIPGLLAAALTMLVAGGFGAGIASLAAAAEGKKRAERTTEKVIVKTVDAAGRVTYSDRTLDNGGGITERKVLSPRANSGNTEVRSGTPRGVKETGSGVDMPDGRPPGTDEINNAKLKAHNCAVSVRNFETVNGGKRIVRFNDNNEMIPLDDMQMAEERRRIEAEMREFCG